MANKEILAVRDVFTDGYYRRGRNEDGECEYLVGFYVVAQRINLDGCVEYWIFAGPVGDNAKSFHHVFSGRDAAEAFADRVKDKGFINATDHWWLAETVDYTEYPDWAQPTEHSAYN